MANYIETGTTWSVLESKERIINLESELGIYTDGVYVVKADGSLVSVDEADETCIAVALIQGEHQFMIEKNETNNTTSIQAAYAADGASSTNYTYFYWGMYDLDNTSITNYTPTGGGGSTDYGYLPKANGAYSSSPFLSTDYTTWTSGALSDFNGKANTAAILAASDTDSFTIYANMGTWCRIFNQTATENQGYTDWYIPACGQLALMHLNRTAINNALTKIGGQTIGSEFYWSSSERSFGSSWRIGSNGLVGIWNKNDVLRVRFIRDFSVKNRIEKLETKLDNILTAVDLSKQDIHGNPTKLNTANCYVVKQSGVYKFPCVYGNAIKNGAYNTTAYLNNGGEYSMNFVNYKGNLITDPWISKDTGETITTAQLSIADADGIFETIYISDNHVVFTIPSVPKTGANGIISIKNAAETIMWNWHIWVWSDDLTPVTITNSTGVNYDILPVNLASRWEENSSSPTNIINWNYQWGRVTPLPSNEPGYTEKNITTYGKLEIITDDTADNYLQCITAPTTHFNTNNSDVSNWFGNKAYYNLWDLACTTTGCSDNTVIKTVYDPCPPGFKIPNGNIFTGFTSGSTIDNFDDGYFFKRNSSDTTGVFFAASGYRRPNDGGMSGTYSYAFVWTSASGNLYSAWALYFYKNYVKSQNAYNQAHSLSIRPVVE